MRLSVLVLLSCALAGGALAAPDPRMVVRVQARDYRQLYEHIQFKGTNREIAGGQPGENYDLVCDRSDLPALEASGLKLEVLVSDLESLARARATDGYYQSYDSLVRVMRNLAAGYPAICRIESIGPSYESRWIYGLKISDNPGSDENEPEMLYFGCIHAREWATPQVCRHLADTLIRNYATNSAFQNYINGHEVWVFPCVNPDGYTYDYPTGRSWRKNRQPYETSIGCDLNRDFNGCCNGDRFGDWGSLVPNSNTTHRPADLVFFGGRGAWGVENNALSQFFKTRTFAGVISFHSYSELVLWPTGYGPKVRDSIYIASLGTQVASRIGRLAGGTYTPQQGIVLYPTNCGSDDWMWGWGHYIGGFPCMSYTVEVGTSFYQATSQLDSIITSNFRGAWYHMQQADAIITDLEGSVPRPILAPLDTVGPDFTLHWTPTRPDHNHPDRWELEELTGLSVVTEDFETGTARWTLQGASRSTTQKHAGTYSISLGTGHNIANYAMTADPYPVQPGDSLTFWVWYNTESNYDVVVAEVSLEGREWVQLHDRFTGNSGGWLRRAYSLTPWAGKSVFIRFRYMTDDGALGTGVYVDDVWPVPTFSGRTTLSSSIPDSFYNVTGKAAGHYYYRARGHNTTWGWNDKGPLEDVWVVENSDVACTAILAPAGTVDSGPAITPRARVRNLGGSTVTFPVSMRVGAGYTDTRTVTSLAPGDSDEVSFNQWTPTRGTFAVACSTGLPGDGNAANNRQTGSVTVRVLDVAPVRIVAPTGTIDSTASLVPACSLYNHGTTTVTYPVRLRIGSLYNQTATVTGHAPGTRVRLEFPAWTTLGRGNQTVVCSTEFAGDSVAANNRLEGSVAVRVLDVAPVRIVAPTGTIDSTASLVPACSLYNYGTTTANYPVRLRIGSLYSQTATVTGHAPGTRVGLEFPAWTAIARGTHTVACTTDLTGDLVTANNQLAGSVTVNVDNVGAVAIVAPAGTVPVGAVVTPVCSLYNYGTATRNYSARLTIGSGYDQSASIVDHAPGTAVAAVFPAWTATATGSHAVACSTRLATDLVATNDRLSGSVAVADVDVGVEAIVAPSGTLQPGVSVTPRARLRNYAVTDAVFDATLVIRDEGGALVHSHGLTGIALAAGATTTLDFGAWLADPAGDYTVTTWTVLAPDQNPTNDTLSAGFFVGVTLPPGWTELSPMPLLPSGRAAKDGAWLATEPGSGRVFAAKGYKTGDFYCCDPVAGTWTELAPWPLGVEAKPPYKGSAACSDGNGTLYATKGNNTPGFWRYSVSESAWAQLADVPLGLSNKKVKGGTDLAYVDAGDSQYVYLLKGYRTEFYRYNVGTREWQALVDAPAGARPKYDKGSWLVSDPAGNRLLAHKAKNHELYDYDLAAQAWGPTLTGMPLLSNQTGRSKKSKDGGSGALLDGTVYTLKGGNTQDFYALDLASMAWTERDTIPAFGTTGKKKRVKAGGDISEMDGLLYALKGNKTREFWRYSPGTLNAAGRTHNARAGVQGVGHEASAVTLHVQTPSRDGVTIRWTGLSTATARICVRDVSGRSVIGAGIAGRNGDLTLPSLAPGIYFVDVTTAGTATSTKLVISR